MQETFIESTKRLELGKFGETVEFKFTKNQVFLYISKNIRKK